MSINILGYWGTGRLHRYPRIALEEMSIPEPSRDFLEHIGLPVIEDPRFRFQPVGSYLPLVDEGKRLRQIGSYDSAQICVKEVEGGIYWYDGSDSQALYMNSSVEAFVLFVTLYHQMLVMARNETQTQAKRKLISAIEQQMRSIDPRAFGGTELYWSMIFEEIGYELA